MNRPGWLSGLWVGALAAAAAPGIASAALSDEDQDVLYYLGTLYGKELARLSLDAEEIDAALQGLKDAASGNAPEFNDEEYRPRLNAFAAAKTSANAGAEKESSAEYLERMAAEPGAQTTDSGLIIRELEAGSGASPTAQSTVRAHYHGTLRDGTVFDSSVQRGEPLEISLERVIPCWTEGIPTMKVGGKTKLSCPSDLAYGDVGSGAIPGGAALTFEVELIDVVN